MNLPRIDIIKQLQKNGLWIVLLFAVIFYLWIIPFSNLDSTTLKGILSGATNLQQGGIKSFPPVIGGVFNGIMALFSYNPFVAVFILIVFSLINVSLVYFIVKELFSWQMGLAAATLYIMFPLISVYSTIVHPFVFIQSVFLLQTFFIVKGISKPLIFLPVAAVTGFAGTVLSTEIAIYSFLLVITMFVSRKYISVKHTALLFALPLTVVVGIYLALTGISFTVPKIAGFLFYGYNLVLKNNLYNADMTAYAIIPVILGVITAFIRNDKVLIKISLYFVGGIILLSLTLPFLSRSYFTPDITHLHILVLPMIILSISGAYNLWSFNTVFLKALGCFIAFLLLLSLSINSREFRYPQKSGVAETTRQKIASPGNTIDLSSSNFSRRRGIKPIDQYLYSYAETKALNNDHVFLGTREKGSSVGLDLTAPFKFLSDIELLLTAAPDFGIIELSLNGKVILEDFDLFSEEVKTVSAVIENLEFIEGVNRFAIKITGKNEESKGYNAGVDSLKFISK